MKFCFISMEYPPETGWGGIGTYLDNITHTLAELGHEVHVIARSASGRDRDYMDEGVNVHRIKEISTKIGFLNIGGWVSYFWKYKLNSKVKYLMLPFTYLIVALRYLLIPFIFLFKHLSVFNLFFSFVYRKFRKGLHLRAVSRKFKYRLMVRRFKKRFTLSKIGRVTWCVISYPFKIIGLLFSCVFVIFNWTLSRSFNMHLVYKKFRELDDQSSFDIIEAPEINAEAFVLCLRKKHRKRLVTRLHTPWFILAKLEERKLRPFYWMMDLFERYQTKKSRAICSPSNSLADILSIKWRIKREKIDVIPYPVPIHKYKKLMKKKVKLRVNLPKKYLLYFGRLEKRKGILTLSKILTDVFDKHPDLKVVFLGKDVVYGETSMKKMVVEENKKYSKNLVFPGRVSHDQVFPILKKAKAVVLPSLWENFANTCLESMTIGKPTIASKNTGYEDMIKHNHSGFLFEPGNPEDLKRVILKALAHKDLAMIGRNAAQKAEVYEKKRVTKDMVGYYRSVLMRD